MKNTNIERPDIELYNIRENNFKIDGVFWENGYFRRIPEAVAKTVNDGVLFLHTNTAGGRVRFITDSGYIAIHAEMDGVNGMDHIALTGEAGFDLYERKNDGYQRYINTFRPPSGMRTGYESVIDLYCREKREYVINFPLYANVKDLYIGVRADAVIEAPTPYKYDLPVVCYGSSITQGGCASRPGNSYQAIISRRLDCNFINLGFSGSARGEDTITEYIKNIPMSCFVYDYDHNAPTVEHLKKTHEKMFKIIREKQPNLPIILMLSRPVFYLNDDEKRRLETVKRTYLNAIEAGDKNVYFIPGPQLIREDTIETATVDCCHPNDSGFLSMALKISDFLKDNILK